MLAITESSSFAHSVDSTFLFIVGVSVFFLVLITALMITFVIKYSRKRNPVATNIHGNIPLEVAWTVIPTILVLVMFWYGWTGYKEMSEIPADAYVIDVQGQMWQWKFTYPNGVQTDSLFIPVNTPVKVNLKSIDVDHSFYVPAFRVKKDVIPGKQNTAWFKATDVGVFNLFCAEYCGMKHSYMITKVVVLSVNDFNSLLKKKETISSDSKSMDSTKTINDSTKTK